MRRQNLVHRVLTPMGLALAATLAPLPVLAQSEPAPAPEAKPAAPVQLAQAETPAAPAVSVSTSTPPPPPVVDESSKPLSVSMWGRVGTVASNGDKFDDLSQTAEVDALFAGKIHPNVSWQADFVGTYGGGEQSGKAAVLDLIAKLEPDEAFNVWFGRMLVPSDRSNFAGPWFMAPWNYPGLSGPREGDFGRNDGVTAWGQFSGGLFKYYAGAFNLHNQGQSPLYSARLNLSLINPEPGFYHSATYYGQDRLAIGVGFQYQKDGATPAGTPAMGTMPAVGPAATFDYTFINADVLYEKVLGGGVLDVEGAFFKPIVKDCKDVAGVTGPVCPSDGGGLFPKQGFFGLASFLIPAKVGIGKLQPLFRFQGSSPKTGDMNTVIDAQVGYVIKDYAARLALGYQGQKIGGVKTNGIFLGLQVQK
jgi:hypothetical protein